MSVIRSVCISKCFILCMNFVETENWAKKFLVEARAFELYAFKHDWLYPVSFRHIAIHSKVQTAINYLGTVVLCCLVYSLSHTRNLSLDPHRSHGSFGVHRVSNYSISFYFFKQFLSEFIINFRLDDESFCIDHSLTRIKHSGVVSRFYGFVDVGIVEYDESVV